MIDYTHSALIVAVCALVTLCTRALPFLLFPVGKPIPRALTYLGRVLPGAIMGMLVVYCFKSTVVFQWPFALPELIAGVTVVGLYLWKRSTLLSIGLGTVLYMVLVQLVFV